MFELFRFFKETLELIQNAFIQKNSVHIYTHIHTYICMYVYIYTASFCFIFRDLNTLEPPSAIVPYKNHSELDSSSLDSLAL